MSKPIAVVIMVLLVFDLGLMAYATTKYTRANNTLEQLEIRLETAEHLLTEEAIFSVVEDPTTVFNLLEDAPAWEEIDAVPYSRCYRHLIGTTTADYIVCRAI